MKKKKLMVMLAFALGGIGLLAFSGGHSSAVSTAAIIDGRTRTVDASAGISFSSRPVTGMFIRIR